MKAMRVLMLVAGILLIICGVMLFGTPLANVAGLAIFLAAVMLFSGIADIVGFFTLTVERRDWWLLVGGVLSAVIGAWLLFGKYTIASFAIVLPILFAMWLIAIGIARLVGSLTIKDLGFRKWWVFFILSFIGMIIGVVLLLHPLWSAEVLGYLIPIGFIFEGIVSIIQFFILGRKQKELEKFESSL